MLPESSDEYSAASFLYSRPSGESLTIPVLQELLGNLNQLNENLKHEVISTVDVHQSQFVQTTDELNQLEKQVFSLKDRLDVLQQKLSSDSPDALRTQVERLKASFSDEEKQIEKTQIVVSFLQLICAIQKKFNETDNHFQANEYDIAAEALMSAKDILNDILSKSHSDDFEVVESLKREFILRRSYLECKLKEILKKFFTFNLNTITVQQQLHSVKVAMSEFDNESCSAEGELSKVELSDAFDALKLLGIAKGQMNNFLKQLTRFILMPLLHVILNLTDTSHCVKPKITTNNAEQSASWSWVLQQQEIDVSACEENLQNSELSDENAEYELKVYICKNFCECLESLGTFICKHAFTGQPELLRTFGKMWWRYVTENLASRLPPPSLKTVKLLTDLEVKMQSMQLISSEETRLHSFALQYYKKLTQEKKWKLLATVRGWIMADDGIIVNVSDETEIGSLTSFLKAAGVDFYDNAVTSKKNSSNSSIHKLLPCLAPNGSATAETRKVLLEAVTNEADSYLRLPSCGVTQNVKKVIDLIHDILIHAPEIEKYNSTIKSDEPTKKNCGINIFSEIAYETDDKVMSVNDAYAFIRQVVTLYIVLYPTVHKKKLLSDSQFTATFFSNCLYLCYHLTTIPLTYSKFLSPNAMCAAGIFLDLILLIRRMQEVFYTNMMRIQQQGITKLIESIVDVQKISLDNKYTQTESILGDILQHIKDISVKWVVTLPAEVLIESIAILLDVFLKHLNKIVLGSRNLTAADVTSLFHLLSSVYSQMHVLMEICMDNIGNGANRKNVKSAASIIEKMEKLIINWKPFCLIKILLLADVSTFLNKREKLLKLFTLEEIRNLVNLNKNINISTSELMTMLVRRN